MNHRLAIVLAMCISAIAVAQSNQPRPNTAVPPAANSAPETPAQRPASTLPPDDTLITLDFKGGTIGEYVNAIRAAAGSKPVNVLYNENTAAIPMYPVRLTSASVWSALGAVERNTTTDDGRTLNVRVGKPSTPPAGGVPTYSIYSEKSSHSSLPFDNLDQRQEMIVLSLNPLVGLPGVSKEDQGPRFDSKSVLSAVESAVALVTSQDVSPPIIKYHEASGLLFVKGNAAQQRAAKEVIARMQDDVERGRRIIAIRPKEDAVVTRRVAVSLKPDQLPGLVNFLKTEFGKMGPIEIEIDGAFLVMTGPASLIDKAEASAKSSRRN
ncbi:MAG: hypothetical protein JSS51_15240 [Planctomycetes bacterium]|nr:hypothetical protein [Planctomycetota bacterium]